ncbi:MAG: type IX secretion system membrane protein PorP/SprF, partial [Flavobacteriaceae bacterium]|nr:type IX secretion system membrane protein PorP/SprF [Flavobacteriaceae bacterium]
SILTTEGFNNENGTDTTTNDRPHFYLAGGYDFDLGSDTQFRPSVMLRYVNGAPVAFDATAAFKFFNKFEVGALYRTDKALGGMAMFSLADWMQFGYAYEGSLRDEISNVSNGTHEILIRFNFGSDSSDDQMDDN